MIHSQRKRGLEHLQNTVKPVLEATCIKRPSALTDHCYDTTTLPKST